MSDEYANITLSDLTPEQIDELSSYGYVPTEWICILYLVLFGLTTGTLDPSPLPQLPTHLPLQRPTSSKQFGTASGGSSRLSCSVVASSASAGQAGFGVIRTSSRTIPT